MKKLALGALLIGLLAACGGGDEKNGKIKPLDSGVDGTGPMVCNPLTQAGCAANEKCTWLIDATMPQYVGHVGCAPDGDVAVDGDCTYGAAGATGYDNCAKGNVCSQFSQPGMMGKCKQLCDQQGGTPTCDDNHVCVTYSDLFSTGDNSPAAAGVCDLACDPITDNDFDGSGTKTKSTMTCGSADNIGCYGYPSFGSPPATGWSCTGDFNFENGMGTGLRHRVKCEDANKCSRNGTIYVNSCNQGYLPLLIETTGSTVAICTALCKPANCSVDGCGQSGAARQGESPHGCNLNDRVGTFQANAAGTSTNNAVGAFETGGDHCTYMWNFEIDDQDNYLPSPTSDKVGYCFDHSKYKYDSNADTMPDTTYPTCAMLRTTGDLGTDKTKPYEYLTAASLACVDTMTAGVTANGKVPASILEARKVLDLPRPLYHRVMK